ncbi:lariat debranching enzyme [Dimargaris verticillata]|uniref:Lariat debranching enzyme n=1 Tax=Dimargaris verticillata TaxID=2761393 RepID=A0A9W8EF07_9FUNG|nr:lariat debranching enzyme [Dimargaris verticillata]
MLIAIEGCCHGELDRVYESVKRKQKKLKRRIELLIICGDMQTVRNFRDMDTMACPTKYTKMGDFYKYYSAKGNVPFPTIFIGGNHEVSSYLTELHHGGWAAKNVFFMGNAGVVRYNGVRIGGLSGVYYPDDYNKGHFEYPPYDRSTLRSVYHTRYFDVLKLLQIRQPLDCFISHDWPRGITDYGRTKTLLKQKPFFKEDIDKGKLGNPASQLLLQHLQPNHWFSAHLHVKYTAQVPHQNTERHSELSSYRQVQSSILNPQSPVANPTQTPLNPEALNLDIDLDSSDSESVISTKDRPTPPSTTIWDPETQINQSNPDAIDLDLEDSDDSMPETLRPATPTNHNPDAISITHSDEESDGIITDSSFAGVEAEKVASDAADEKHLGSPEKRKPKFYRSPIIEATNIRQHPDMVPLTRYLGVTNFLALDKCIKKRDHLDVIEIDVPALPGLTDNGSPKPRDEFILEYDPEWLAITRALHAYTPLTEVDNQQYPPTEELQVMVDKELKWVYNNLIANSKDPYPLRIPNNFRMSAPITSQKDIIKTGKQVKKLKVAQLRPLDYCTEKYSCNLKAGEYGPPYMYPNKQTKEFCQKLGISDYVNQMINKVSKNLSVVVRKAARK